MARGKGKEQVKEVQKPPTKKAKPSSSKRPLVEEEEVEERNDVEDGNPPAIRRTSAHVIADKELDWKNLMPTRGFKNERQVDISKMGKFQYGIRHIYHNGLEFWTKPLAGYNKNVVIEFYQNMKPLIDMENSTNHSIVSKVGRVKIVITPDVIATYLNYVRPAPGTSNYPIGERENPIELDDILKVLYKDVRDYTEGDHISGKFKADCILVNKAIHVNLYPRGVDTKPTAKGAELIYVFMSDQFAFDAAEWIFRQLLDFKFNVPSTAQMPFPCMITALCKNAGVQGLSYNHLEELRPGVINKGTFNRSKSQSKTPSTSRTSMKVEELYTPPDDKAKPEAWYKKQFHQNAWIIKELQKGKAHRKWVRKETRGIKHRVEWQTRVSESITEHRYEAPPEIEEEDSDDIGEMNEEGIDPGMFRANE
ncbi:hypothetical protein Vadar_002423 [Vaccinium darrowii]|uniref:Uncharacterized protein n=1 Tax=Vaccinium darrowii TaxID=229202 RepID=A0ACB7Y4A0_9ERIC|nr:hypothetical protein Vadar_002423 [Vaccinium darrowii]